MTKSVEYYIGRTRGKRGILALETLRTTPAQVWDAIFYNIEKSNAQFNREAAPRMLGKKWQVIGVNLTPPPSMEIKQDKVTIVE